MPVGLSPETEQMHIDDLVQKINRKAFARRVDLIARANDLAQEYDLPLATDVRWVSNQNSRWGSCTVSHGTIRLSDRMADFPQYVIDFVLLHELTHLVEANHDAAFHALMERFPRAERAEGFLEAAARFR